MSDNEETKIVFKKRKQRSNIRSKDDETVRDEANTKVGEEQEDDDSVNRSVIDEFRELKRIKLLSGKGVNVMDLLSDPNQKKTSEETKEQVKGGVTSISKLESELDLGQTFSAETNKRDEDSEMNKYIDKVMAGRLQTDSTSESGTSTKAPILDQTHDMFLKVIPEKLLALARKDKQENQEMLSSQMLTSIPEVDLGIDEKIKNIEKTEAARAKYFHDRARERAKNQNSSESLAPKNISSCYKKEENIRFDSKYIQQSSSNNNDGKPNKAPVLKPITQIQYDFEPVVQIGDAPATLAVTRIERSKLPGKNTPSDDFVFEKFRKN